jgi:hypothetical protein
MFFRKANHPFYREYGMLDKFITSQAILQDNLYRSGPVYGWSMHSGAIARPAGLVLYDTQGAAAGSHPVSQL